jgi:hypothetical protein
LNAVFNISHTPLLGYTPGEPQPEAGFLFAFPPRVFAPNPLNRAKQGWLFEQEIEHA